MDASEFLFPKELQVTATKIKNVLVIGSCQAEYYVRTFRSLRPDIHFDYIAFYNLSDLPPEPPLKIQEYDFISVHLPLRAVLSDRVVNFADFVDDGCNEDIVNRAFQSCRLMLEASLKYNVSHKVLTFVANFSVPQVPVTAALGDQGTARDLSAIVRSLNEYLAVLVAQYQNVYVADVDSIGNAMGKRYFQDDFVCFYSHVAVFFPSCNDYEESPAQNAPKPGRIDFLPRLTDLYECHLDQYGKAIWQQQEWLYRAVHQIDMVKLVIFDLDDTLWRGQIAEHYEVGAPWPVIHGWPLGIWETIHHLRARGILTAVCSKNEERLVRERWDRGVRERWVALADFVITEINWRPKAENIGRILQQVNLTPKSVVFVDDNPVERDAVKSAFPEIRTIGSNPYVTRRVLLWSSETQIPVRTKETANRETMIRRQQARETERLTLSREEFLRGLGCRVRLGEMNSTESDRFARSLELLNKTNQFNTTGRRWNVSQMSEFFADGGKLYFFEVEDKFTHYGLVGVILFKRGGFEQFAMSCRVIGLDIETSVINLIVEREKETSGSGSFCGQILHTSSNIACRDLFARCGFEATTEDPSWFCRKASTSGEAAAHLSIEIADEAVQEPVA